MQEFFLRKAPLYLVIDNHAKRSFERADVNTIISVAGSPERGVPSEHVVRFVAFKRPFEEAALSDNFIAIEHALDITRTEDYRVVPLSAAKLLREGSEDGQKELQTTGQYEGDKWGGKYLRAPDIYFTILDKGKGKLVPLQKVVEDIKYGIKTGADGWFHVKPLHTDGEYTVIKSGDGSVHIIETEFLVPIVRSLKECEKYAISLEDLEYRLVVINVPRNELHKYKAFEYVIYGETTNYPSRTGGGIPAMRPSCSSRGDEWYRIPIPSPNKIKGFMFKLRRDKHIIADNRAKGLGDDALYEIYCDDEIIITLLNSTLFAFLLEVSGRFPGGGSGPLAIMVSEAKKLLVVDPKIFSFYQRQQLQTSFDNMARRKTMSIFDELGIHQIDTNHISTDNALPDRKALDDIVFDALGLTEDERKEVYRAVCQLVWERISKAKSV